MLHGQRTLLGCTTGSGADPCELILRKIRATGVCKLSRAACHLLPCLLQNEQKSVKMMNQSGLFRIGFIEELQAQILEMTYTTGKLSMFVLLPSPSEDNLKALQEVSLLFHVCT